MLDARPADRRDYLTVGDPVVPDSDIMFKLGRMQTSAKFGVAAGRGWGLSGSG
jgi:hypothetical protein